LRHKATLDSAYFEDIFASDEDPWQLGSSPYEAAKFEHSVGVLSDRHYLAGFEIGCAQGDLTQKLAPLCDGLLAIDVSATALTRAARRCESLLQVKFVEMGFPNVTPDQDRFDLIVLSEVAYYWDTGDLGRAACFLNRLMLPGGRILLVHWTGDTDYPQSGDQAVEALWDLLKASLRVEREERCKHYRLDLWCRE